MKILKKTVGILLMALPFIIFDFFIRLYIGKTTLDGNLGIVMPVVFDVLWIMMFVSVCLSLPKKIGKILYVFLSTLFGVWTFANYIYHCVFKQFLWISDISMAEEGSNYFNIVLDYAPLWTIFLAVLIYALIVFFVIKFAPFGANKKLLFVSLGTVLAIVGADKIFLSIAQNELENGRWEIWQRPALIYNEYRDSKKALYTSGLYQYTGKSIAKLFEKDKIDINVETEFAKKHFTKNVPDNEMTGLLKDKNIIFVLMESIDDFLISDEFTPNIKRMMEAGINFANHYSPNVGTGYTFNSEFAANTGFYCPTNTSSASVYTKNFYPQTIANRLKDMGYTTSAIHFNSRQFYNREVMYKRWGYDKYYCLMDYIPVEKCVIDSEASKSSKVLDLIIPKGKFMTYFITYSAHLPYNVDDNKLKGAKEYYPEMIDNHKDMEMSNLRLLARDTDEFFKNLNNRLEEMGLSEKTAIVAYTDHYAYGINNHELLLSQSKEAGSDILEKTPFFIYCKGISPKTVTKATSNVDIMPTLENLIGLEKNTNVIGNDAFSKNGGLVYFPDGRWCENDIFYDPAKEYGNDFLDVTKKINDMRRVNDFAVEYDYNRQN